MRQSRLVSLVACGLAAGLLAGCSSVSESMALPALFGDGKPKVEGEVPDEFRLKPTCPEVEIRAEAESMRLYEGNKTGDANALRYQSSIQRVARDCDIVGEEVVVRVGVAGRVVAGPKGGAGTVQVPLRVVVTDAAGKPVYSRAHIVPVSVEAPDYSALWSQVDDQVRFSKAQSGEVSIIVGIDEMALKGGAAKPARPAKRN